MSRKKNKQPKAADKVVKRVKKAVLSYLQGEPGRAFNHKQIGSGAQLEGVVSGGQLIALLDKMVSAGQLVSLGRGRYGISKVSERTETGKLDMTREGFGFLMPEGKDEELFIPEDRLNTAMPGDRVRVRITRKKGKGRRQKAEAEVVEIMERFRDNYVGTIQIGRKWGIFIPDDPRIPYEFIVPKDFQREAKDGQKVLVKILNFEGLEPQMEVEKVLGDSGENETEMHAILHQFGFQPEFEHIIEAEAEAIPKNISRQEIDRRRDMRKELTFTIDPADAKDFDDALSFKELPNGNIEVGVHIADVTHYLKPGTELDKEAYKRATSVYLVDRTVSMLPEVLSNNLCSLRPKEDKLTFSAVFELDKEAKIVTEWVGETVIHSDHRFTYEEAQEGIEGTKGPHSKELQALNKLAKILQERRFSEGSLGFEDTEVKFVLDEKGKPISVYKKNRVDAHKLIEDFMLLANRRVPVMAKKQRKGTPLPFIYRIHDRPNGEKLDKLRSFVKNFGYDMDLSTLQTATRSLHQLVLEVDGKPEQNIVQTVAIRTMAKAIYSTENIGHYGLGFSDYAHFTSPIRRYPDVMVHRLMKQYLRNDFKVDQESLRVQCRHCSARERLATDAERASIKYKQVEFLQDKIGEEFDGIVSGVTKWGIYVEVIENKCEGMIYLNEIPGDYFEIDEDNYCVRGRRTGKEIHLGDPIRIKVKSTNLFKRVIDFEMVSHPEKEFHGQQKRKVKRK